MVQGIFLSFASSPRDFFGWSTPPPLGSMLPTQRKPARQCYPLPYTFSKLTFFSFKFYCSPEDVERCKQKDLLAEMLAEMTGDFPTLYKVFVSERDQYLARSLRLSASPIEIHSPDGGICLSSA